MCALLTAQALSILPVSYTHLDVYKRQPLDLAGYKAAITEALYKGTKRNVVSEDNSKNAVVE